MCELFKIGKNMIIQWNACDLRHLNSLFITLGPPGEKINDRL